MNVYPLGSFTALLYTLSGFLIECEIPAQLQPANHM